MNKGILGKLFNFSREKNQRRCQEFQWIMSRAVSVFKRSDTEGLRDLIRIILRPIQAKHIRDAYICKPHKGPNSIFWDSAFGINGFIPGFERTLGGLIWSDDCLVRDESVYPKINLASDITFPTCWHPSSLVGNLGSIGEGLRNGRFEQSSNHMVMLAYPFNVGWVAGGNHSITQAILRGQGEVIPEEVHDYSVLIEAIKFDGFDFRSTSNDEVLGRPIYREFGWMWEIGRAILKLEESPYKETLEKQKEAKTQIA